MDNPIAVKPKVALTFTLQDWDLPRAKRDTVWMTGRKCMRCWMYKYPHLITKWVIRGCPEAFWQPLVLQADWITGGNAGFAILSTCGASDWSSVGVSELPQTGAHASESTSVCSRTVSCRHGRKEFTTSIVNRAKLKCNLVWVTKVQVSKTSVYLHVYHDVILSQILSLDCITWPLRSLQGQVWDPSTASNRVLSYGLWIPDNAGWVPLNYLIQYWNPR